MNINILLSQLPRDGTHKNPLSPLARRYADEYAWKVEAKQKEEIFESRAKLKAMRLQQFHKKDGFLNSIQVANSLSLQENTESSKHGKRKFQFDTRPIPYGNEEQCMVKQTYRPIRKHHSLEPRFNRNPLHPQGISSINIVFILKNNFFFSFTIQN